jgi:hypothetical protein
MQSIQLQFTILKIAELAAKWKIHTFFLVHKKRVTFLLSELKHRL